MADVGTPTLEDLRNVPEAAWLWDGARARVVWANPAGVAYFGGASLFDLVDRPFDFQEPGVEQVMNLSRSLRRGQVETTLLHFPSSGADAPLACRCMIHALADGRPGVLVVARHSAADEEGQATEDIAAAFDLLPTAALLTGRGGGFRHLNAAALLLLGAGQRANLAGLLGSAQSAEELLSRIEAAGTVVLHKPLAVRLGTRDIRITAKRLNRTGDEASFALLLLDDVTERRALELKLSASGPVSDPAEVLPPEKAAPRPASALSDADAAAFAKLGQAVEDGIRQIKPPPAAEAPAAEAPAPAPPPPRRKLQRIPDQVRLPLENRSDAVLVAKDGQLLFANPAAARLFGHETGEDVINDSALSARFGQLGQSLPQADIATGDGRKVEASVQMTVIPWLGGPARQFLVHKADATKPDRADLRLAPAHAIEAKAEALPDAPPPAPVPDVEKEAKAPDQRPSADVIQLPLRPQSPEADQELRAILDTAADGIITLDPDARIHTFSAGAEAIFGYRIAEVAGKPFFDLLSPDSRKMVRDYISALQGPGLAAVFNDGREVTALVRQGGTVPLFLTIGKLQAPRSQAAFCAVVRDITQWKKTEAELREAKDRAEATSRQKSEFLASVSHELRTPLNAIMGFSEVMRLGRFGDIGNERYRGYVQDIHASGSHLLSLINDLLDLSKVEAGKIELNFTSVSLSDVADYVLKLLQEQATAARVVLRKSMPADLPNVVADLRSMRQALLNLVSNAIKFTDAGGQVVISAQLMASGELKFKVKDTGIGMDEEQLRGALEPFGRIATEGRDAPGTGLGLPLTKALVEANRARLSLSSEPRRGTLAEITFPTTRVLAE
ncbi:PAS domain-containing sensor histidine kinase [Aestuariivirga sp.]|uniref:sensor histidine kinase n=1 Tax=Aestuariivirga sp. TaxID=2650926 RepID=UPI003BAA9076